MKNISFILILSSAIPACSSLAAAREIVVLPGVVNPVGVASGVDTQGPGLLTVGSQDINTGNDAGGAITTDAANTARIAFTRSSTVTGAVGRTGATFLDISAGTNGNTVTFNGPVFSTTFSVAGTGSVIFNGGFTSNSGSTMDFAGDGFITVGAGQTVKAAITNTAGAGTGTLTLYGNSILDGAVGAASGLKQINVVGGNALITGQVNSAAYTLGTNTLNVAGAFAIPVAGVINTTIFSNTVYGKIVPVGAASIGNALQVNVLVTGPIDVGTHFNIIDATSGTDGSTVTATSNTLRYLFSASPTTNGLVQITATQVPLVVVVGPTTDPTIPVIAPIIDTLPLTPVTAPLITAITLLPSAPAISNALKQLVPSASNLASPQVSYRVTQQFQNLWASHLEQQAACGQTGSADDRQMRRTEDTAICPTNNGQPRLWAAAFGYFGEQDTVNGFDGYKSNSYGGMVAYDMPISDTVTAGLGARYAQSTISDRIFDNDATVKSYQAMAYIGYAPGPWFANAALIYGLDDYSNTRHVVFTGVNETANGDYHGHQYTAFATTGYHFYVGDRKTVITPLATLQYTRMDIDAYSENGGGAVDLNVASQNYDFLQSGLGIKAARDMTFTNAQILRPDIHFNWLHSFGDTKMENTAAFVSGGQSLTVSGLTAERDTYSVGAGLSFISNESWQVEGVYDYQWRSDSYSANQAMVKLVLKL